MRTFSVFPAAIGVLLIDIAATAGPATRPAPANEDDRETRTSIVWRGSAGSWGDLVVKQEQRRDAQGRFLSHIFTLQPSKGAKPVELTSIGGHDPTPFGDAEPTSVLVDALITPDPVLVAVFHGRTIDEDGLRGWYEAFVWPIEGTPQVIKATPVDVPQGYASFLYAPDGPEAWRKASVSGSLKAHDLTVSLEGPHETLRFRFELFVNGYLGWVRLPGPLPATRPSAIAPDAPPPTTKPAAARDK